MYYGGFSYTEAFALDIPERVWFIQRIIQEVNKQGSSEGDDAASGQSPPMFKNISPEMQALMGQRAGAPNRLQRA